MSEVLVSNGPKPFRNSYSGTAQFCQCERLYMLERVWKRPRDPDSDEDATALRYGKAFHSTLEACRHRRDQYTHAMLADAAKQNELDPQAVWSVYAAINSYLTLHEKSKLDVIAVETEVGSIEEEVVGYIDAVMADKNGFWWIVDLKTAGQIQTQMFPRLTNDPQLNLYASYAKEVAEKLGLDPEKFAGTRYRVVGKTRIAIKPNDTMETYAARANPKCYDIEMLARNMPIAAVKRNEEVMRERIKKVRSGEVEPVPNFSKCFEWQRPCSQFSYCYGKTYTECANEAVVFDHNDMIDRTNATEIFL